MLKLMRTTRYGQVSEGYANMCILRLLSGSHHELIHTICVTHCLYVAIQADAVTSSVLASVCSCKLAVGTVLFNRFEIVQRCRQHLETA